MPKMGSCTCIVLRNFYTKGFRGLGFMIRVEDMRLQVGIEGGCFARAGSYHGGLQILHNPCAHGCAGLPTCSQP